MTEIRELDNCLFFYEKSIEGRNFHYKNYNTWTNYYAVFTGALFVGYYSIITDEINEKVNWLAIVIVLVGLVTSICWHLTVKGHYHWMFSWIKIVQKYEEELSEIAKQNDLKQWRVYSVYFNNGEDSFQKNISSQKLTSRFTFFIEIAWPILAVYSANKTFMCFECCKDCCKLICICFSVLLVFVINLFGHIVFTEKSDTSGMKDSII